MDSSEQAPQPKTTQEILELVHQGKDTTLEECRLAMVALSYTLGLVLHKVKYMKDHPWPKKLVTEAKEVYTMYEQTMGLPPARFLGDMEPGKPGHAAWRKKVQETRDDRAKKDPAESQPVENTSKIIAGGNHFDRSDRSNGRSRKASSKTLRPKKRN